MQGSFEYFLSAYAYSGLRFHYTTPPESSAQQGLPVPSAFHRLGRHTPLPTATIIVLMEPEYVKCFAKLLTGSIEMRSLSIDGTSMKDLRTLFNQKSI